MSKLEHNIDVSVIIPVHNSEKYLAVCVESVMCQGDQRMEIILVDDGSTDLSGKIADEYAKKEKRIKVIHQENGELLPPVTQDWISPKVSISFFWIAMTG